MDGDNQLDVTACWVEECFHSAWGRGWQSRLAEEIGVAPSTVSGWLKAGNFPKWAEITMRSLAATTLGVPVLSEPSCRPVLMADGKYAVCVFEDGVGTQVAGGIEDRQFARILGAAPDLYTACYEAFDQLSVAGQPVFEPLLDLLEATLKLAADVKHPKQLMHDLDERMAKALTQSKNWEEADG